MANYFDPWYVQDTQFTMIKPITPKIKWDCKYHFIHSVDIPTRYAPFMRDKCKIKDDAIINTCENCEQYEEDKSKKIFY